MSIERCVNNAPFIAFPVSDTKRTYRVIQACCNSWTCPRCGIQRAKHEYGRIVNGVRELEQRTAEGLFFITITCRGREMSLAESEGGYLLWTNRLLSTLRANAKKRNIAWSYVQVTERQKRGHPHSHLITTYYPQDIYLGTKEKWSRIGGKLTKQLIPSLRSEYLLQKCVDAGLGSEYDISEVSSGEAVSRYVAKYLFKDSMLKTEFPDKWKRVRYSQNFPKLEDRSNPDALALVTSSDWSVLRALAVVLMTDNETENRTREECFGSDILIKTV